MRSRELLITKLQASGINTYLPVAELDSLIAEACSRITSVSQDGMYVGTSGGKDSSVIVFITREVLGLNLPLFHTVKPTQVHELTVKFLYQQAEKYGMLYGHIPGEGYVTQVDGTRIAEFNRDDGRSTTFVSKGKEYPRTELTPVVEDGLFGKNYVYPILDWSDDQVWSTIIRYNIPVTDEYLYV